MTFTGGGAWTLTGSSARTIQFGSSTINFVGGPTTAAPIRASAQQEPILESRERLIDLDPPKPIGPVEYVAPVLDL